MFSEDLLWSIVPFVIFFIVGKIVINIIEDNKKNKKAKEKEEKRKKKPKYDFTHDDPERWFTREHLREGHTRAGHRCEYTHTKTGERCSNRSGEGGSFLPLFKKWCNYNAKPCFIMCLA